MYWFRIFCKGVRSLMSVMAILMTVKMAQLASDNHKQRNSSEGNRVRPRDLKFFPTSAEDAPIGNPANIPIDYIVEEKDFCSRQEDFEVITYVHSAISRVTKRMNTRKTWASMAAEPSCGKGVKLGVVFVVGLAKTEEEEAILKEESELYHDIVQGNYVDDYHLLSYKALSSLYWIDKNCPTTPWTLHADDDILIDTFLLKNMIEVASLSQEDRFICNCLHGPVRRSGKWTVSLEEFSREQYPLYCKGTMWLLPTRRLKDILTASTTANFLWVDDAFITGVLAEKANIGHKDINENFGFTNFKDEEIGRNISWYHLTEEKRLDLWDRVLDHHNCSQS